MCLLCLTSTTWLQSYVAKEQEAAQLQEELRNLENGARALREQCQKVLNEHALAVKRCASILTST